MTLFLAGCENKVTPANDVETLQQQVRDQFGTRQAEIQLAERVVAAYEVCSWIVNICTKSVETEGMKAQRLGHTGAANGWLWLGLFTKGLLSLSGLAWLILSSRALASWMLMTILQPKRERLLAAQTLIKDAQTKANKIVSQATAKEQELSAQCDVFRCDWLDIEKDAFLAEQKLSRLLSEIEIYNQKLIEAKATQAAVDVFKKLV